MCCLRNEQRREQSPDENSTPTILAQRFTIFPPASAVSVLKPTGGGNPSEAGRAICGIDTSKYASRIVDPLRNASIYAIEVVTNTDRLTVEDEGAS
jgi:hypothetical protein